MAYAEPARDRSTALRREWAIKQLSREEKEAMIAHPGTPAARSAPPERFVGFRAQALTFFRQLKRQNTRPWFEAHRSVYEREVRQPMRDLVEELDVALAGFAPEIVGDPRRSMFRIHRDVRFSRDKSPYKTHAACWFYHVHAGRGVGGEAQGGAGFYFQLAPGDCLLGAGIWMPPRDALNRIREQLAEAPEPFESIVRAPAFRRRFGTLDEEAMLKRLPRGYTESHPAVRWLRFQSFTVGRSLSERQALSPRLAVLLARDFAALTPFVRWLNAALGFRHLERRL
jgi:uncharacterized protein (TIGR02453 family)